MKHLAFYTIAALAMAVGAADAQERIPVAVMEGQDMAAHPQISVSPATTAFLTLVNNKLAASPTYSWAKTSTPKLQLNLLALETSAPNEFAFAYVVNAYGANSKLSPVTTLELRTCSFAAVESCADSVMRALDAGARFLPK